MPPRTLVTSRLNGAALLSGRHTVEDYKEPLYFHITASTQEALDTARPLVQSLIAHVTGDSKKPPTTAPTTATASSTAPVAAPSNSNAATATQPSAPYYAGYDAAAMMQYSYGMYASMPMPPAGTTAVASTTTAPDGTVAQAQQQQQQQQQYAAMYGGYGMV
jgi:hypothetical protein